MAARIRAFDWTRTPLGPIGGWPQSLKTIVDVMLASPSMMSLVWGADAIHLYNDAFTDLLREHGTVALGRSAFETFARSRDAFAADVTARMAGSSKRLLAQRYPVLRNDRLEDVWFDVDYAPVRGEAGEVAGVLWTLKETTAQVLAERALRESEARHRLLLGTWAQAIWEADPDGAVVTDSPSWRAYTGQTLEQWLGFGWLDAIHPDDRAYAERQWREAIAAREPVDAEFRLRAPEGGWRWTNVRAAPVIGEDGRIEKWAGINIDIDTRRRAENALRESETRYRALFETMGQGFCELELLRDKSGRAVDQLYLELNPAFERLFGIPAADAKGRRASEVFPELEPWWHESFDRIAKRGEPERIEYTVAPQGRWFEVHAYPRGGDRLSVLYEDITERKSAEAALRESEARLTGTFESVPAGIGLIGTDGRVLIANEELRRYLPGGAIPSRDPSTLPRWRAWDSEGRPLRADEFPGARALRGERVVPGQEMLFTDEDEQELWTRESAVPIRGADNRIGAVSTVISDIDVTKRAAQAVQESEARQAFLLKLSDGLRPLAEPAAIQDRATRTLGEHLQANRVAYVQVTDDEYIIERDYVRDIPSMAGRHRISAFGPGKISDYLQGRTRVVRDTLADAHNDAEAAESFAAVGVRAGIGVPLTKGGRFVATLAVHMSQPRDWTPEEIALAEETAERTWAAIERAQAEAELRRSEERLRQFGEASQDILWIRDATTLQWTYLTPAFETIYGLGRDEALSGDDYRTWQDLILSEDRERAVAAIERVLAGEQVTFEYRVRRPSDGTIRWLRNTDFPILDDTGKVVLIGGVGHDMTDLKAVQVEIAENEGRLRTLTEGIPQLVWRAVDGGEWTWASPQWTDYTGQTTAEARDWSWLEPLHPDDRARAWEAWSGALERGGFEVEYRIRRKGDGAYRWFQTRAKLVRDRSGGVVEWLGTSTDTHELRRLQELQGTLLAELQHRVRNILAITRSIVRRSDDGERSTEDYVQHLEGRISALARTQVMLTRAAGAGVDLEELIRDELLAQVASADQFTLAGPDVELSPKAAEVLTLAIHELATNATKYGVFFRPKARLDVRWSREVREDEPWLTLDWTESGVPIVESVPRRRGLGAELVSRRIPYELGGHGVLELRPGGLHSRIEFPLTRGDSILQTDGVPR